MVQEQHTQTLELYSLAATATTCCRVCHIHTPDSVATAAAAPAAAAAVCQCLQFAILLFLSAYMQPAANR